jgi:hypothetical protein
MFALSLMLLGLIGGPTSSQAIGDTNHVAPRSGPTLQAARAALSAIDPSASRPTPMAVRGPQRQTAVAGAVFGGVLGLGISLAFAQDSDSNGGEVGSVVAATAGGALVGFVLGALIAGPE